MSSQPGLTSLSFGRCFNRPLAVGVLPSGLTTLAFGFSFNQPLPVGVPPSGLTSLRFGDRFKQPLLAGLLLSLRSLRVSTAAQQELIHAGALGADCHVVVTHGGATLLGK